MPPCGREAYIFGAFRCGNKPPVLLGEYKRAEQCLASPCQGRWHGEAVTEGSFVISPSVLAFARTAPSSEGAEQGTTLLTRLRYDYDAFSSCSVEIPCAVSSIFSANIAYPFVGSSTSTWVSAPINFPF